MLYVVTHLQDQLSARTATLLFQDSLNMSELMLKLVGRFLFASFPVEYLLLAHPKFPSSQYKMVSNLLSIFFHYGEATLTLTT